MLRSLTILLCALLCFPGAVANDLEPRTIRVRAPVDANGVYSMKMVHLALSKIDRPYVVETFEEALTQAREFEYLQSGKTDIAWAATEARLERDWLPIRIPLYKGLLGHRVFIIHRENQARFDGIDRIEALRSVTFGQGTTWADSTILASNGLQVVKANKYESLFYMVDGGRFDAFPRGVNEPWQEIASRPDLELAVEKRLMLVYRMPFYLFTGRQNTELAADLERGLNAAIADGSFDAVFFNDPMVTSVIEKADLANRRVFELRNPTLPELTPVDRPELWLDLGALRALQVAEH